MRRLAAGAAALLGIAFVALYAGVALARIRYPFELEWMEGGMVEHVRRILEGRPVYAKPDVAFVSFLYPPGYYLASAAVAAVTGVGFFPLRLLSFVSSLGAMALLADLARRETGSWSSGAIASGLFAATFARSGGWLDLARLDSFYLLVLLAGIAAARHARFRGGPVVAGALLAAAFFTKQSALVVIVPLLAWALLVERRRALAIAAVSFGAIGAGLLALHAATGGWFSYYCLELPSRHPRVPGGWASFWTQDVLPALPLACVLSVAFVAALVRGPADRLRWFLPVLAAGLVLSSWSVRNVYGAEVNNLLPAFAAIALLAASSRGASRSPGVAIACDLAIVLQLALLAYAPGRLVPSPDDLAAGRRFVQRLSEVEGEIFVPHHGYIARLAGKPPVAHTLAIDNVLLDDTGPARQDLEREIRSALAERRFGAAVIESDGRYRSWIEEGYEGRERLFADPGVFWPVSGGRLRPETLALPRAPWETREASEGRRTR